MRCSRQPQGVEGVGRREQRADDVLDSDAAEALAEVGPYHLGPVARDDDEALDPVTIEGPRKSLEDRRTGYRHETLRPRVGQRRQASTHAGGEQQCGPCLPTIVCGVATIGVRLPHAILPWKYGSDAGRGAGPRAPPPPDYGPFCHTPRAPAAERTSWSAQILVRAARGDRCDRSSKAPTRGRGGC